MENISKSVQDYYGKELQNSSDLKTNACCTAFNYPHEIKNALAEIHDEVMAKYYGCGLTIPSTLEGLRVLDLGSGSGRDCYLTSKFVGESGYVIGVDMTDEQLAVANKHIDYHTQKFGYNKANIEFRKGEIEKLDEIGLENNSLDLIISNCVINLSTNKEKVIKDCFNLLKQGGEMYFSDVYVNRRIPSELASDEVIYGECLGGALYWKDFENYAKAAGFADPRIVEAAPITIENCALEAKLKGYEFYSVTYRLFKLDELEQGNENYGQSVVYKGTIKEQPETFLLDENFKFNKGEATSVCGNTFKMLSDTRFKDHFDFNGSFSEHLGTFNGDKNANPFAGLHCGTKKPSKGGCC